MMDRMTDREKYRTLGGYYLGIAQNFDQAIDNYTKLVSVLEEYQRDTDAFVSGTRERLNSLVSDLLGRIPGSAPDLPASTKRRRRRPS